jgi:hypothetical protein
MTTTANYPTRKGYATIVDGGCFVFVPLGPIVAKCATYFREQAERTASVDDVVEAVASGRVTENRIPRCGALLQEALRTGRLELEEIKESEAVR